MVYMDNKGIKKMEKHIFWRLINLFLLTFLVSCGNDSTIESIPENPKASSNIVSLEEAKIELEQLLDDTYNSYATRNVGMGKKIISNAFTINDKSLVTRSQEEETPIIHVFNFANKEGFAIMSGNREMPSLLALADSGEISQTEAIDNPGFSIFLENMEEKYKESISTYSSGSTYKVYGKWHNLVYKPNGYCKVKWGQESPYNAYCPLKNGEQTLTGCVATAVAQLMTIEKYPYSHNGYSYDWTEMTAKAYGNYCTESGKNQIARLMIDLGTSENLNMSYNTKTNGGSGAKSQNIPRTLKNFGYSDGGHLIDYNTNTIVSELKNKHSVLVSGFSHKKVKKFLGIKVHTSYSGGHQWLCHGLLKRERLIETYSSDGVLQDTSIEEEWYVLCNWGWDGYEDGYYLSKAFNTVEGPVYPDTKIVDNTNGSEDYNYQYKIQAIVGIRSR